MGIIINCTIEIFIFLVIFRTVFPSLSDHCRFHHIYSSANFWLTSLFYWDQSTWVNKIFDFFVVFQSIHFMRGSNLSTTRTFVHRAVQSIHFNSIEFLLGCYILFNILCAYLAGKFKVELCAVDYESVYLFKHCCLVLNVFTLNCRVFEFRVVHWIGM